MTTITVRVLPDGHRYHSLVAFLRRDLYDFSTQPNDGKPLVSGALPHGVKLCDCPECGAEIQYGLAADVIDKFNSSKLFGGNDR